MLRSWPPTFTVRASTAAWSSLIGNWAYVNCTRIEPVITAITALIARESRILSATAYLT
jgi:hypothetical protein